MLREWDGPQFNGKAGVAELQQGLGELHLEVKRAAEGSTDKHVQSGRVLHEVEASVQRLETRLTQLEASLKKRLEQAAQEGAAGRKEELALQLSLQAQLSTLVQLSGEIKQAQAQAAGSSSGWIVPTLVCGQMLVLAAFLFYRQVAKDKKRDHFL